MFDAKQFLRDKFGSAGAVLAFASAYGVDGLNLASIEKWFQRGGIPGRWLVVLLALLELEQGRPVSLTPYITRKAAGK